MNPNLPFMVYNILKEFDPDQKGFMPLSRFYKSAYLVHKRLKKRKIESGLPWSWYIYGPEVEMGMVPGEGVLYRYEGAGQGYSTKVFHIPQRQPLRTEPKAEAAILYEIKALAKEKPSLESLLKEVYDNPPKKVLRVFKDFDDILEALGEKATKGVIDGYLDQIGKLYSEEEFGEMLDDYLRLDSLVLFLAERDMNALRDHKELVHDFRVILATKASALFNENVPEDWKTGRIALAERRLAEFEPVLEREEAELYANLHIPSMEIRKYTARLMETSLALTKEV